jgi:hypothetical protein
MTKARDIASAIPAPSTVSSAELGYLDGVTSAVQTQLNQKPEYAAGKNAIINGDFGINQRGFTSTTTNATYGFDRFLLGTSDGTCTYSAQTFTAGTAPVAEYEATNFAQIVTTGQTLTSAVTNLQQKIESVRTLAGQTVTFSFWAKANTGTPNVIVNLIQNFGTGGSPSASVTTSGTVQAITTSWARYSSTITLPSISGKTIGTTTDGHLTAVIYVSGGSASAAPTVGIQSNTFQIWGVQVEAGSTATHFQTATGTKQGELAACQRYYYRYGGANLYDVLSTYSPAASTTVIYSAIQNPVPMRVKPSSVDYSTLSVSTGAGFIAVSTVALSDSTPSITNLLVTCVGLTQFRNYQLMANNTLSAYLGFSAEL